VNSKRLDLTINGRFVSQKVTGVQRVARELTREIDRLVMEGDDRFRVRLVCQTQQATQSLDLECIEIDEVKGPDGWLWEQTVLPRAVPNGTLLCLGNTAPIASLLRGQHVALMIHDLSYERFPDAYRKSYRLAHRAMLPTLLKRADPIFTVSKTEEEVLASIAPFTVPKLQVAQNGGWRRGHRAVAPPPPGLPERYVLYVGSLSLRKNLAGLLDVATRLAREDGIHSVLVGTVGRILTPLGYEIPADVKDHVHFLGQIDEPAELGSIYRGASCLIFPSFYEASAIPPIEAMHFGCPVVTSRIPSMLERCGEAAEYCDPWSTDSILDATRRVLRDRNRAAELVRLGYEREECFSWRAQAQLVLDAIHRAHSARA
jgi:glycosyltransferase involved in cell wall biosynthesis